MKQEEAGAVLIEHGHDILMNLREGFVVSAAEILVEQYLVRDCSIWQQVSAAINLLRLERPLWTYLADILSTRDSMWI